MGTDAVWVVEVTNAPVQAVEAVRELFATSLLERVSVERMAGGVYLMVRSPARWTTTDDEHVRSRWARLHSELVDLRLLGFTERIWLLSDIDATDLQSFDPVRAVLMSDEAVAELDEAAYA
jgi:hypothetical protein